MKYIQLGAIFSLVVLNLEFLTEDCDLITLLLQRENRSISIGNSGLFLLRLAEKFTHRNEKFVSSFLGAKE